MKTLDTIRKAAALREQARTALFEQACRDAALVQRIGAMLIQAGICDAYAPYKGGCWHCDGDALAHEIYGLLKESHGPRVMVCQVCKRPIDRSSQTEVQAYVSSEGATCAECYRPITEASR